MVVGVVCGWFADLPFDDLAVAGPVFWVWWTAVGTDPVITPAVVIRRAALVSTM